LVNQISGRLIKKKADDKNHRLFNLISILTYENCTFFFVFVAYSSTNALAIKIEE
jgi:hypothetical protein